MTAHAKLSPSSAHRWLRCPGSVLLAQAMPECASSFADEGTCAHEVAAQALVLGCTAAEFIGQTLHGHEATAEMAEYVQTYLDALSDYTAQGKYPYHIEYRVDLSPVLGDNQFGTADCIVICGDELQVHDLKYGRGVAVSPEHNEQLMLYALGALPLHPHATWVRLVIHQPRLVAAPQEWDLSVDDLRAWGQEPKAIARRIAALTEQDATEHLAPGDKQCRWCPAKAGCPALAAHITDTITHDFVDLTQPVATVSKLTGAINSLPLLTQEQLATAYGALDLIEAWSKAVAERVAHDLAHGKPVPGYKRVAGRMGNRAWADEQAAEKALKAMRLRQDEMYSYKVISPTQAEKLLKDSPKRWAHLLPLITRADGKPTVAPVSDPRPELPSTADDFPLLENAA